MNEQLITAYRFHRAQFFLTGYRFANRNAYTAAECLAKAREDVAAGKTRYPRFPGNGLGAVFNVGSRPCRFVENPADVGLRRVGTVGDDIGKRLIDHTGWFADVDHDAKYQGVVYQLPGKDGHARFMAGYEMPDDAGGIVLEWTVESVDCREGELSDSDMRDVIYAADGLAEISAEESREYDNAWQAGMQWQQNREEIDAERKDMRETAAAARKQSPADPKICDVLTARVKACRRSIRKLLEQNDGLAKGDGSYCDLYFYAGDARLIAAFNDGAGKEVIK